MAQTNWAPPDSGAEDDDGYAHWIGYGAICFRDGGCAYVDKDSGIYSNHLVGAGFSYHGLSVPAGAVIDNILFRLYIRLLTASPTVTVLGWAFTGSTKETAIHIVGGGGLLLDSASWQELSWSDSSGTITADDINTEGAIKVALRADFTNGSNEVLIDDVALAVIYTPSGYPHKVLGCLPATIAKIMGIPTANIAKFNGV